MHRSLITLALVIGATAAYAGAKIEWNQKKYDFGAFREEAGPATANFVYYNTGDEPLVITGARANCGCTTPKFSAETLQPGDSAALTVTYDPEGRPGRFEKMIYVDTNTEPKRSVLRISGVSIGSSSTLAKTYPIEAGPLKFAQPGVLMGTIQQGHAKSIFASAYNASTDTLRPVIVSVPRWIDAKVLPEVVPPGEQLSFSLYAHSETIPEWDMVTDTITIRPDASSPLVIKLPAVITLAEDFASLSDKERAEAPILELSTRRLDPVTISRKGTTASFTITNNGKSPLKIRRIYSLTPGITTNVKKDETVKPGKTLTVNVSLPSAVLGASKASAVVLNIISNDPANAKTTVTVPVASTPDVR